jgi:hypothetical protein
MKPALKKQLQMQKTRTITGQIDGFILTIRLAIELSNSLCSSSLRFLLRFPTVNYGW